MPEADVKGSEIVQIFDGIIIRNTEPARDGSEIINRSGVVVDKVDLVPHLDDLEQVSLLEDLQDTVNPFDVSVQKEIPKMPSVVLVDKHDGLVIDMTVGPRRYVTEGIENGSHHKNDGYD